MANKKINELSSRTPALSDLMIVGDPSSGYSYKCTVTALATIIETDIADGYVTIGTTQTISGAKTFSNNLTLTSVVNTPTDPDKFLTLNASNVVTYRTGAEVLSDIGGQAALNGTGIVKSTGGTISYLTDNSSNWNSAYDNMIVSAAVTGTTTKTLTLTQQDSGTITASWTDDNSGTVTSVGLGTGTSGTDVNVSGSPITSSGTITLNIPTASATNRGALSSADWTTFNNKQNALTLTTTGTSGAATLVGSTLNIPQYQGVLTNPVTGTGTTNYIPKFTSSSAIGNSAMYESGGTFFTSTNALNVRTNTSRANITTDADLVTQNGLGILATSTTYGQGYQYIRLMNSASAYTGSISQTESTGIGLYSASALIFGSSSTERMRLDASGNLGIGTSSPSYPLTVGVGGSATGVLRAGTSFVSIDAGYQSAGVYGTAAAPSLIIGGDDNTGIWHPASDVLAFSTAGSERMRLDASGNLGLGVTPSTWSIGKAMEFRTAGNSIWSYQNDNIYLNQNATFNGAWYYGASATAAQYILFQGNHIWQTAPSGTAGAAITFTERMRLDINGNLGLGVQPSAWSLGKAMQFTSGAVWSLSTTDMNYLTNTNYDGSFKYVNSTRALRYFQDASTGIHAWYNAPSGTAGNAISFTQAMTLDASGNLFVGLTSNSGLNAGSIVGNSVIAAKGFLASHQTSIGVLEYNNNVTAIRSYGATAGTGVLAFNTGGGGGSADTERMRITSAGGIGINGTNPSGSLDIYGNTGTKVRIGFFTDQSTDDPTLRMADGKNTRPSYSFVGDNTSGMFGGSGFVAFSTSASERMRITSAGNVGIGTTSPQTKLAVSNAGALGLEFDPTSASGTINNITSYDRTALAYKPIRFYAEDYRFVTSSTEAMRLTSAGELLINTTSDAGDYKLQVNGNVYNSVSQGAIQFWSNSNNPSINIRANTGYNAILAFTQEGVADRWSIGTKSADATLYFSTGDALGSTKATLSSGGNLELTGSIKTAAPSGGTAKPIKFGEIVTLGGSNTQGVRVEIDGTVYYLVTGYLP